jgi:putative transcriptional regulator
MELNQGILLLSDPFLKDPNFARTAILLCEHTLDGSFGLVLNKKSNYVLSDLVEKAIGLNITVYDGGPVQQNTLHFIHRKPNLISESVEVADGIFWGGSFETIVSLLRDELLSTEDIPFFVGYSGWSEGQLAEEFKGKSWIIAEAKPSLIFLHKEDLIWKKSLDTLGGEYAQMSNYPTDPQLN